MWAINLDVWSCHLDFFQLRHIMLSEFIQGPQVGEPGGFFALSNYLSILLEQIFSWDMLVRVLVCEIRQSLVQNFELHS
jgi:hypothetical protein